MADAVMRAVALNKCGPPDVLKIVEIPVPHAAEGQILVKVHAAGTNPVDCMLRSGKFLPFLMAEPKILGADFAGIVLEDTAKFKAGEKVFGMSNAMPWGGAGTYAEFHVAKEEDVARMPANLSFEEAAGIPLVGLTAWEALDACKVKEGARVLIHAGAGGVGSLAIQLAKARGAHVITTAGSRNIAFVKELGADEAIDYTQQRFEEVLKGRAVDAVIDPIGRAYRARSLKILKRRGHYLLIPGGYSGMSSVLGMFLGKAWGFFCLGPSMSMPMVKEDGARMQKIADLVAAGKVKPVVDRVFPLEQAREAHAYLEQGHARGKVILRVQ